ncbi:MAG: EpsI family protein [Burkholderiales bacterium]|nr:MAG: EpsI family protein [Burkholderiales bacterium]
MGMRLMSAKGLLFAVAMVASYMLAERLTPTVYLADTQPPIALGDSIPKAFGKWHIDPASESLLINPSTAAFLKTVYTDNLSRTYINDAGDRVMLAIAYGRAQADGHTVHFPEICYPAQGFKILSSTADHVSTRQRDIAVTRLVTQRSDRTEPITYWVEVGDQVISNNISGKLVRLRYGFKGVIPDGLLFRVSTIGPDTSQAWIAQNQFIRDLLNSVSPATAKRLAGTHNDAYRATEIY